MSTDVSRPEQAQPASDRVWSIETNGINPIPESERHGKPFDMFWIWCAANIGILGISYGTYLVSFYGLNFPQSVLAGVVGTIVSFLLVGWISLAGMLGSAPTLVLSRAAFGFRGNAITTAVSYISLVGWETVLVALATFAAEAVLDRLGVSPGKPTLAVSFVVIALITIAIGLLGHATILRIATWFTWAFAFMTVVFVALEWSHLDWSSVSGLPSGTALNFIGGMSVIMAGLGIGWVNAAADYSRYLPRSSSRGGIVWWTSFGASIAPIVLIVFGALLAANHPDLASSANPIGDLGQDMPTWFLVPYLLTAVGGLVAGAMLDIYSSGLNLLTLGVKLPRYQSVVIDGTIMVAGNIYILFVAQDFIGPFIGFLVTLGVLLASWAAIFLVDMLLYRRRTGYDERELYSPAGRYGSVNMAGVVSFLIAAAVGLGLVTSTATIFKWTGYLINPLFPGTKADTTSVAGQVAGSSIGLLIAFVLAAVLYAVFSSLLGSEAGRGRAGRTVVVP
jgi:NCS1 family nucleobase:cation symporter-1